MFSELLNSIDKIFRKLVENFDEENIIWDWDINSKFSFFIVKFMDRSILRSIIDNQRGLGFFTDSLFKSIMEEIEESQFGFVKDVEINRNIILIIWIKVCLINNSPKDIQETFLGLEKDQVIRDIDDIWEEIIEPLENLVILMFDIFSALLFMEEIRKCSMENCSILGNDR